MGLAGVLLGHEASERLRDGSHEPPRMSSDLQIALVTHRKIPSLSTQWIGEKGRRIKHYWALGFSAVLSSLRLRNTRAKPEQRAIGVSRRLINASPSLSLRSRAAMVRAKPASSSLS